MNAHANTPDPALSDIEFLQSAVSRLDHVLPDQGPILDFVHHNTIHGFQHLPFFEALAAYENLTGIRGFQSSATSREFYRQGRITDADLDWAMTEFGLPGLAEKFVQAPPPISCCGKDVYREVLLHELPTLQGEQLNWRLLEGKALRVPDQSVSLSALQSLRRSGDSDALILQALWQTLQNLLSEAATDQPAATLQPDMEQQGREESDQLFNNANITMTMRELFRRLTGKDVLDGIRPVMIRLGGSVLDEGLAQWHLTDAEQPDLYQAWRRAAQTDLTPWLEDIPEGETLFRNLPDSPWQAIAGQLQFFGLPRPAWPKYLELLALELPGWAGLINWRQKTPGYRTGNPARPALEDFLAIRLVLDRLFLGRQSHLLWHCGPDLPSLQAYFQRNPAEFVVRCRLFRGELPEYLTNQAQSVIVQLDAQAPGHRGWQHIAEAVLAWERDHAGEERRQGRCWQLFQLCQHLGLDANALRLAGPAGVKFLERMMQNLTPATQGRIWLLAFERHYRDNIFRALCANRARGGWLQRSNRPKAQIVMCMDEREESFRRHLEELDSSIETFGAAGFFGVPMRYKGLDAHHSTPLCPVVVTPVNQVHEETRAGQDDLPQRHARGRAKQEKLLYLLHQRLRHGPLVSMLAALLLLPVLLLDLLLCTLQQKFWLQLIGKLQSRTTPAVKTSLQFTACEQVQGNVLRHGFTDQEQAERVTGLLRTLGLTAGFAPVVALAGHGSTSQNNPHEAAHDCGACGGRQGGPNARVFAAMANRTEVRQLLAEQQDIHIPEDTWFVGMQHDTCSDLITWYDTDLIPGGLQLRFAAIRQSIGKAQRASAHERCRRFMSATGAATPDSAFDHVVRRSRDLTQVRPEYGHATNAAAVIGRRQLTQGVFFDRRLFLISYDPESDPEGRILENILLTAGPVGAGINLEYYFSTIDNERFGCGTKIPHNVTGLCAVMEGAGSDLRTGLPLQMVEIHEAMRLQVIVEAETAVLARIYADNPPLQELIGGGWLLVSAVDPQTGTISVFDTQQGFVVWNGEQGLPLANSSFDCYRGLDSPVDPVLIRKPVHNREAA